MGGIKRFINRLFARRTEEPLPVTVPHREGVPVTHPVGQPNQPLPERILDHPLVSQRVFYPRSTDQPPDLVVDVDGALLACHVHHWHSEAGVLIHFHGNGELAAEYAAGYAELFFGLGVNVCFVEYRGYGRSTGTPALSAMRGDGERVVRALGVDPGRCVAFGRSLGSLYAVELAARLPHLAGVVIESGVADLAENWLLQDELAAIGRSEADLMAEVRAEFDLRRKLSGYRGGLLVLHAVGDQFLSRSHADRLHSWGGGTEKRLVVFPDGNHNTILFANYREYVREIGEFLRRVGVATNVEARLDELGAEDRVG